MLKSQFFCCPVHSVVCEIGPARAVPPFDLPVDPPNTGPVVIKLEGGREGTSKVVFTYRVQDILNRLSQ